MEKEQMKTVKEVCEITGLTRKHLYMYDKAGIVKPTKYKNAGYEGIARKTGTKVNYDGYKLYDENAVYKLQQISIFVKLKMKPNDIIAIFKSDKTDREIVEEQIKIIEKQKQELDEILAVAEQLKLTGIKGEFAKYYASSSFSELASNITWYANSESKKIIEDLYTETYLEEHSEEIEDVFDELVKAFIEGHEDDTINYIVNDFLTKVKNNAGFIGWFLLLLMGLYTTWAPETFVEVIESVDIETIRKIYTSVNIAFQKDLLVLKEEYIQLMIKYHNLIGSNVEDPGVKELVTEIDKLLLKYTGLKSDNDYNVFYEMVPHMIAVDEDIYMEYTLRAMKHYHRIDEA